MIFEVELFLERMLTPLSVHTETARSCDQSGHDPLSHGGVHSGAALEGRGAASLHNCSAVPYQ